MLRLIITIFFLSFAHSAKALPDKAKKNKCQDALSIPTVFATYKDYVNTSKNLERWQRKTRQPVPSKPLDENEKLQLHSFLTEAYVDLTKYPVLDYDNIPPERYLTLTQFESLILSVANKFGFMQALQLEMVFSMRSCPASSETCLFYRYNKYPD